VNPQRLAELEEERTFLLRSIRDLEQEHSVGDVDDDDFHTLRDGYVARAAAVLREIDDGRDAAPAAAKRPWWRRASVIVATLVAAGALGLFVANSAGQRLPGQSLTGGQTPDEVAIQLAKGRQQMGSDFAAAAQAYARVIELEPDNAEAHTYGAWLGVLAATETGDKDLLADSMAKLRKATEYDPTYADPHCLLAVASGKFLQPPDNATVQSEGAKCLALNPPAVMVSNIQNLIDSATGDTTVTGDSGPDEAPPATDPTGTAGSVATATT